MYEISLADTNGNLYVINEIDSFTFIHEWKVMKGLDGGIVYEGWYVSKIVQDIDLWVRQKS